MDIIRAARDGLPLSSIYGDAEILSARDQHGSGPLHWAAGEGHLDLVISLCSLGLDANEKAGGPTTLGRTPLHFAARNGRLSVIEYFVKTCGVDPDVRAHFGVTPLQLAVYMHHPEACRLLLEAGADPLVENEFGCTLSHWFAMGPDTLQGCEFCTDVDATNDRGHTPLHKAAFAGRRLLCEWLILQKGASRHAKDKSGKMPADEARFNGHKALANWLAATTPEYDEGKREGFLDPEKILFLFRDSSPLSIVGAKVALCLFQHGGHYKIDIPNLPKKYRRLFAEDLDVSNRSSLGLPRGGGLMRVLSHPSFVDIFRIERDPTPSVTLLPRVARTLSTRMSKR